MVGGAGVAECATRNGPCVNALEKPVSPVGPVGFQLIVRGVALLEDDSRSFASIGSCRLGGIRELVPARGVDCLIQLRQEPGAVLRRHRRRAACHRPALS
jgi:hypothetical protein